MNIKQAIETINNLDVSGLRRKLSPKYSLIQLDQNGEIVGVYKFKMSPTHQEQFEALNKHPRTVQIPAREDMYKDEQELQKAIDDTMWLFDKIEPMGSTIELRRKNI